MSWKKYDGSVLLEEGRDIDRKVYDGNGLYLRDYSVKENAAADVETQQDTININAAKLVTKARTALTNNSNFLTITNPTNAQEAEQVQALTKQVNALIKLQINDLLDTTGT